MNRQKIIETELNLNREGWIFFTRLKSGSIVMAQEVDEHHQRFGVIDTDGNFRRITYQEACVDHS